jgi:hypothetical protein
MATIISIAGACLALLAALFLWQDRLPVTGRSRSRGLVPGRSIDGG